MEPAAPSRRYYLNPSLPVTFEVGNQGDFTKGSRPISQSTGRSGKYLIICI